VVPLLQQRGLFRTDYDTGTLRDRFALPRPEDHFPSSVPALTASVWPALTPV